MNFIGPGEDQGIRIYHDGNSVNGTNWRRHRPTARPTDPKTIKITIGREIHANLHIELPSVQLDELLLFNKVLTAAEITILSNVESYH